MPSKQVTMWENEGGDLYDTKEEADFEEARNMLRVHLGHSSEIDVLDRLIDSDELQGAFQVYANLRTAWKAKQFEMNERPEDLKKVLG